MSDITLNASARQLAGKGASRRLRRLNNEIPAIIYGLDKDPETISILHKDIYHAAQDEAFFSSIISLSVDGNSQQVLLKDLLFLITMIDQVFFWLIAPNSIWKNTM